MISLPSHALRQKIALVSGFVLFFLAWFVNPLQLDTNACRVIAVALLMITWWITEALPMPAVALIPIVMFPLMGIATISATTAPYANEVIFLFMGGFMIGLVLKNGTCTRE